MGPWTKKEVYGSRLVNWQVVIRIVFSWFVLVAVISLQEGDRVNKPVSAFLGDSDGTGVRSWSIGPGN